MSARAKNAESSLDRYDELALALERPITLLLTLTSDRRERDVRHHD